MELTLAEIANVIHPKNNWQEWANIPVTGVEFDSRKISIGNLFVPLKGERDGHDFVDLAIQNGMSVTLWDTAHQDQLPDVPFLLVEDCLLAMQQLAHYYREKREITVIAVTGSNGKTTTKDMLASVFAEKYSTYKTQGNYNNHIGLPYTILHMPSSTQFLVLEMGMDHPGEIETLSKIATPDIAVITMIGESHIEYFGTRDKIADAKLEIVSGLKENGVLVVSGTEPLIETKLPELGSSFSVLRFNEDTNHVIITERTKEQTFFYLSNNPDDLFKIPTMGDYNVLNAAATICIAHQYHLSNQTIQAGFDHLELTKNRTQWVKASNGADILNDTYNANPTAMHLILTDFFKTMPERSHSIVLGDMLELGSASQEMHESIARDIPESVTQIFLFGNEMRYLYNKLFAKYEGSKIKYYKLDEKNNLIQDLMHAIKPDDMLLIKGSNGMHLTQVVEALENNPR